jgi:hypothetical protein
VARDGSGNYSLPSGNPVSTGTTVSSTTHNTTMTDIANAITASIAKDGQTTPTANLPMGGFRHTGVASGTARDHYSSIGQVQDSGFHYVGSVAGTDTITGSLTPAIASYPVGLEVLLSPLNTNTGAVTLALNGLGAKGVFKDNTSRELAAGDLVAGGLYKLYYNGSSFYVDIGTVEGSFTGTLTGCTTSPTGTVYYARNGRQVTLHLPALSATSNATTMTVTGLPAHLQPTRSQYLSYPLATDNGSVRYEPYCLVSAASGTITFGLTGLSSGWASSGTKGIYSASVTYLL